MVGVYVVMTTGSLLLGWLLVPGGMLALEKMRMNDYARLWVLGGAVANLAVWTLILYVILDLISERRKANRPAAGRN